MKPTLKRLSAVFSILCMAFWSPELASEAVVVDAPSVASGDAAAIARTIEEFKDAYNRGDLQPAMAIFGDDLVYMGAGRPTLAGKAALDAWRASLQDTFARYDRVLDIVSEDIKVSGNLGLERGYVNVVLTPKSGGETITDRHRFLDVWEKSNGRWRLVMAMNNR